MATVALPTHAEFGSTLRRRRVAARVSLAELARQVNYSKGHLSKIENGRAPARLSFARRCDELLATGGELAEMIQAMAPAVSAQSPVDSGAAVAVAFLLAVDAAHKMLRDLARDQPLDIRGAAAECLQRVGVYAIREQMLSIAPAAVAVAAEAVFLRLVALRDAVRASAKLESIGYHTVYHSFAESLWALRMAVRVEVGQSELSPAELHRSDWSDRERCIACDA